MSRHLRNPSRLLSRTQRGASQPSASIEDYLERIGELTPPGSRMLAGSKNDWRIRVGDNRVVYEIADEVHVVRVNRVRHHHEVYR